ncbi:winged helix-turn-helix transcriptional regulator [Streptomyces sp. NPDC056937]|uniref:winged helix-turn-helix transcriptional regulator n=1 Tax=Streptomyces sp. NPDC056937 TaxID=3345969 RepID=UPI003629035F
MPDVSTTPTRHTELVDQAVARLSPRWTTWTLQTIQQRGPMRLTDINSALPWVGVHAMAQIMRRMQASSLLDRPQVGVYDLTPLGRDTQHVHRALSAWHRAHLTDRTASIAEAEHVEDALGRLRGKEGHDPPAPCPRHRSLVSVTRVDTTRPDSRAAAALARSTHAPAMYVPQPPSTPTTLAMHVSSRRQR